MWFDLLLEGSFSINGISAEISDCVFPGEKRHHISHNDAMADVRLLDHPVDHRGKIRPRHFLEEYLAIGMNEFLNNTHYEEVKKFLNKETSYLKNSELFKPEIWKGRSLRISDDFISIYGMSNDRAHIKIGHHIILFNMTVYPVFKPDGVLFDERVIKEIERILARDRVKKAIKYCAVNRVFNHRDVFTSKIPGCNMNKTPPVRFY